jgi:hypothetical protein
MNLAEQVAQLVGRGFSEERAETIVLMREAAIIIFDVFPDTLVLVGGANLVLFQDSVRHSADLDFFPVSGELPDAAKLSEVLLSDLMPLAKLLNLHPLNLKTISSEGGLIKLMLSSNSGTALFTVDITKVGSVLKSGVEELPLEATAVDRIANIKFVSRDQLLLNKAEAILLRRSLKARDAYDAMDLLAKGASLPGNLKGHLEDMLYGEFDADRIRERIQQVDAKRCRAELKDHLPDAGCANENIPRMVVRAHMDWSKVIASESKTRAIIQADDYARRFKLSIRSVHAALKRQEKKGFVERVSNKIYINKLAKEFRQQDLLHVLRPDAYISLESALSEYGVTSQNPRVLTCVSPKYVRNIRSKTVNISFRKLKKDLYWGFSPKKTRYSIYNLAAPEKALLDWIYFRRSESLPLDMDEFVLNELDRTRLLEYAKRYPAPVENEIVRLLAHTPRPNSQPKDVKYLAPAHAQR